MQRQGMSSKASAPQVGSAPQPPRNPAASSSLASKLGRLCSAGHCGAAGAGYALASPGDVWDPCCSLCRCAWDPSSLLVPRLPTCMPLFATTASPPAAVDLQGGAGQPHAIFGLQQPTCLSKTTATLRQAARRLQRCTWMLRTALLASGCLVQLIGAHQLGLSRNDARLVSGHVARLCSRSTRVTAAQQQWCARVVVFERAAHWERVHHAARGACSSAVGMPRCCRHAGRCRPTWLCRRSRTSRRGNVCALLVRWAGDQARPLWEGRLRREPDDRGVPPPRRLQKEVAKPV